MNDRDEQRVKAGELTSTVSDIFERCGMTPADASLLARSLVAADLRGVHSHGILRVPDYVKKLTTGGVDPRGRPQVVHEDGVCLVVDGGNSMGQIGATFAMEMAVKKAQTHGIGAVAIRGSNHCGALAYFAGMALPYDMIGFATTNSLPTMAAWGGAERVLGINPVAIAVPAGVEHPLIYDAAFSGSSHGKMRIYHQKGLALPEGWATDLDGHPTTDPTIAMKGLLQPIGGFKGIGLAMMAGIFSSMLSGAAYAGELGTQATGARPGQDGHFVAALRISAFEDIARFKDRIDRAIREMHACKLAPGFDRIYVPGEPEALHEEACLKQGIPLNAESLNDLREAAARFSVAIPPSLR